MSSGKLFHTSFNPNDVYPLETVAVILDVSDEWVRKNLIYSKKCGYKKQGNVYLFRGDWLIRWASDDYQMPETDGGGAQ